MTPTHTNKKGVRYSYYVSQAVLRKQPAGSVGRVAAPELEALVVDAVRRHVQANSAAPDPVLDRDRELIERHLLRATLSMSAITLHLRQDIAVSETSGPPTPLTIPWSAPAAAPVKGIVHVPAHNTPMKPRGRETLLIAIAKARKWIKEVERGQTFAHIADRDGKAERHVRHLAPLAFVSPRIISAIIDGTAPAWPTATLAARLPYSWAEQEQRALTPSQFQRRTQSRRLHRARDADRTARAGTCHRASSV